MLRLRPVDWDMALGEVGLEPEVEVVVVVVAMEVVAMEVLLWKRMAKRPLLQEEESEWRWMSCRYFSNVVDLY